MVAIVKFIISAALLSQASAAVIQQRATATYSAPAGSYSVIEADDPVLAVPPPRTTSKSAAYGKFVQAAPTTSTTTSASSTAVPTSVSTGKLIVGDPVLATRSSGTHKHTTLSTSTVRSPTSVVAQATAHAAVAAAHH